MSCLDACIYNWEGRRDGGEIQYQQEGYGEVWEKIMRGDLISSDGFGEDGHDEPEPEHLLMHSIKRDYAYLGMHCWSFMLGVELLFKIGLVR